jgi:hypothetical protein
MSLLIKKDYSPIWQYGDRPCNEEESIDCGRVQAALLFILSLIPLKVIFFEH